MENGTATVCIIGAGISGISAANNLSDHGIDVALMDKMPYPGGKAISYGCKAADSCVRCGVCLVREAMYELREERTIRQYYSTCSVAVERENGTFHITTEATPNIIDYTQCVDCGACSDVCPENAIKYINGWQRYVTDNCTKCGKCVAVCMYSAIDLERDKIASEITASSVILASGYMPFDPRINLKYGYGNNKRVITGSDLERLFFEEKFLPDFIKKKQPQVAFIQCVGSRNTMEGTSTCSRVCCAYALRMANRLAYAMPDISIDFYYIDIQHFGKNFEKFWTEVSSRINLINTSPVLSREDRHGHPVLRYEAPDILKCREKSYDLVILSHGISPSKESRRLAQMFDVGLAPTGFFEGWPDPQGGEKSFGVFPTGSCMYPMRIEECVEDAARVSQQVLSFLGIGM